MSFQVHTPAYPLNRFVRYFYSPTGRMPYREEKVLPSPQTDLKINFGGTFMAKRSGEAQATAVDARGWFMGVWDQYHTVVWPEDPDFIGVTFWPGGAHALLGIDINALHNRLVALDDVWGSFTGELRERLYLAGSAQARFALLERVLTARIDRTAKFEKIAPTLQALQAGAGEPGGVIPMPDYTPKHLISLFNCVVGVSPKRLARLCRLQKVIGAIDRARPVTWTAVAQDFLFADQAHFNKEFKFFTGHTPGDYLARRKRVVHDAPDHASYPAAAHRPAIGEASVRTGWWNFTTEGNEAPLRGGTKGTEFRLNDLPREAPCFICGRRIICSYLSDLGPTLAELAIRSAEQVCRGLFKPLLRKKGWPQIRQIRTDGQCQRGPSEPSLHGRRFAREVPIPEFRCLPW